MKICEEPFYSIQGEGDVIGYPSIFLRLAGCNLHCTFCDTKYSWNKGNDVEVEVIVEKLLELKHKHNCLFITITGGEPLLQSDEIIELVDRLRLTLTNFQILIETNGTIEPKKLEFLCDFSVSPKLNNSGNDVQIYRNEENFWWANYIKFVIGKNRKKDINEVTKFVELHNIPVKKVILQPDGRTKKYRRTLRTLMEYVIKNNIPYRVLPQQHVIAWGQRRGV